MTNASITLTKDQIDELGRELDAIKLASSTIWVP